MTSNFDTSDRNAQKGGDFVPRLAMINDIAGFGRCSTTVLYLALRPALKKAGLFHEM